MGDIHHGDGGGRGQPGESGPKRAQLSPDEEDAQEDQEEVAI
jgi:hypothetical protein